MLGHVRQVAATNQQQAHAVHVIVIEDIILHESVAYDVCGQVQVVQSVKSSLIKVKRSIFSSIQWGLTAVFRLANPQMMKSFSALVCVAGSLMMGC
jgi:hypothetical protein